MTHAWPAAALFPWVLLVLPLAAVWLRPGAPLGTIVPAALMVAAVAWVHRPGAPGAVRRVAFELRLLQVPALLLWVLPALVSLLRPELGGLLLTVLAPLAMAFSLGVELEEGRLAMWLGQPLPRWRLLLEKQAVAALLVLGALLQGWAVSPGPGLEVATVSCVLALGLAPYLVLVLRDAVLTGLATGLGAWVLCAALRAGSEWAGLSESLGLPLLVAVAAGASGVALRATQIRLGTLRAPSVATLAPWWRLMGQGGWKGRALRVWLRKELRLQVGTGLVAGLALVGWGVTMALPDTRPAVPTVLGFFGLTLGVLAGLGPIAAERTFGTSHLDVLALPRVVAWHARVGVAFALALLGGVVLPVVLGEGAQVLFRKLGGPALVISYTYSWIWVTAVLVCTSVGLAASTLVPGLARALLIAYGALFCLAVWVGLTLIVGDFLVMSLLYELEGFRLMRGALQVGREAKVLVLMGMVFAVALTTAWRAWRTGPARALRLPVLLGVALAGGPVVAGMGLAIALW
jgi:hypothetical protein